MYSKDEARHIIQDLVTRFGEQLESYKKTDYNETLVRRDFIDPFFKALGWDIDNSQGYAEAYREVIHEDKLKVGSATKAPDYSFRLPGGKRLFFVEAKKPSVALKTDIVPAYQVRRYAWSAKLPVSLLTDFEELAIYDCNKKPKPDDKASVGRIKYLTFNDYLPQFDFLWDTFSKERVLKGSFDKFIAGDTNKKGTTTVDKDFLISLDEWRIQLAQNIALRNAGFSEDDLNYAVQQTIDRIIFLRIAEDRGVEEYGRMKAALKGEDYYANLFHYFKDADEKYNSGLFDFKKDKLSKNLLIDNKVLRAVINDLYYPASPYEFSVLSVEILGSAYEQFLGKQIKLSGRHKAVIEEKPEVRKAGGVYYTPQYIVEYIVSQTVGRLTEGKTPEQVAKLKIADPACGSGSFLIGAYQYLLRWHADYYKPEFTRLSDIASDSNTVVKQREAAIKLRSKLPLTPDGNLTTALKKQILTNNIFGVDIDTQAVEVTKLSLLLKCMEGETQSSMSAEMRFGERILPTLDNNIKSGNSLIDLDFYDGQIDYGDDKKIKPFSWKREFPEIFRIRKPESQQQYKIQYQKVKKLYEETDELVDKMINKAEEPEVPYGLTSGFDIIIGNPPYVMLQNLETREVFEYALSKFSSAKYKIDTYQLFIEQSIKLLRNGGLLGFITPNTFLKNIHAEPLRKFILDNAIINEILLFNYAVFASASVDTCIGIFEKGAANKKSQLTVAVSEMQFEIKHISRIKQAVFAENNRTDFNLLISENDAELLKKIEKNSKPLHNFCGAYFGIQTFNRDEYVSHQKKNKHYEPVIDGGNIEPYKLKPSTEFINYIPSAIKSGGNEIIYRQDRICIRQIGLHPIATFVPANIFALNTVYNVYLKKQDGVDISFDIKFLLGIINSNITRYYWKRNNSDEKKTFPKIKKEAILSIPVATITKQNENHYSEIITLVNTILQLNHELQQTTLPEKHQQLQQRINYTDEKINKIVYELYGLSEEEINIIEN